MYQDHKIYTVYNNGIGVYEADNQIKCLKWLMDTYPDAISIKELIDDGIRIK